MKKKAEAKWTMPATLFHAAGDDDFQWRFELCLGKSMSSEPEADLDELRIKLCLATSPSPHTTIYATFSIYVNDDQEVQVVFQHIAHDYKCVNASSDLINNLEFGKPGHIVKLSQVSVRCIVLQGFSGVLVVITSYLLS